MPIETVAQTILVTTVGSAAITLIEDTPSGGYARTLRVFGVAEEGSAEAPLLLTVVLESDWHAAIELTSPDVVTI